MTTGLCQRLIDGPASIQPSQDADLGYAQVPRPLRYRSTFPRVLQQTIASEVVALFLVRRPAAVLRGVGAIAVHAIKRMLCTRLRPHVRQEGGEVKPPTSTDLNPSTSVQGIRRGALVVTAHLHANPCAVLGLLVPPVVIVAGVLREDTTATLRCTRPQRQLRDGPLDPAGTATDPVDLSVASNGVYMKHSPVPKNVSEQRRQSSGHSGMVSQNTDVILYGAGDPAPEGIIDVEPVEGAEIDTPTDAAVLEGDWREDQRT